MSRSACDTIQSFSQPILITYHSMKKTSRSNLEDFKTAWNKIENLHVDHSKYCISWRQGTVQQTWLYDGFCRLLAECHRQDEKKVL